MTIHTLLIAWLPASLLIFTCSINRAAELDEPRENDGRIALLVSLLLEEQHVLKHKFDDVISRRMFDRFLYELDPHKMCFLQADIDEFLPERDKLDDHVKGRDISFSYKVFKRFRKRVDQWTTYARTIALEEFDFTVDETIDLHPSMAIFPQDEDQAREIWRKHAKYGEMLLRSNGVSKEQAKARLVRRYLAIKNRVNAVDADDLLGKFVNAMTTSFDEQTSYYSEKQLTNFRLGVLKLEGIGVGFETQFGAVFVSKIVPGGSASNYGKLEIGDRVLSVSKNETGEWAAIEGMTLEQFTSVIRGKDGTKVRLRVQNKFSFIEDHTIPRASIKLDGSEVKGKIVQWPNGVDGAKTNIGVIEFPAFYMDMAAARAGRADYKSTTRDLRRLLKDFTDKDIAGVVLDLRHNQGGALNEVINCTGLFIDRGPVLQVQGRDEKVKVYDDVERGVAWSGPLVILTSRSTSSGAELMAGALQEYGRALVVGDEKTKGLGSVQKLIALGPALVRGAEPPNIGAIKLTVQHLYRPSGFTAQQRGIAPDIVLPSPTRVAIRDTSAVQHTLDPGKAPPASFKKTTSLDENLIAKLRTNSVARCEKSKDFVEQKRLFSKTPSNNSPSTVTLNASKFLESFRSATRQEKSKVESRDFYFDEVLAIMADLIKSSKK